MYHARSLLFMIYFYVLFVNGTTIPLAGRQDRWDSQSYGQPAHFKFWNLSLANRRAAKPCPDGLPGRVTQIQQQSLEHPGIFITDCSPSQNNTLTNSDPFEISTLSKRQEQICPADCSNQCSGDSGGPSASDCANLANQLNNRNTQFTVSGSQTISMTYGTCMFQLVNMVSSAFIYCDTNWATRSTGVVNSCLPQSSGGMCQGSRFQAVVAVNNLAPAPTTAAPAPAPTTANNPATTNQGGGGNTGAPTNGDGANTSSSVNGGGNASNSNSASGNTAGSNTVSSSAPSGALPTPSGSQSGGSGSHTTTLSNGSVLVLPTASFAPGRSSETGNQQSSTSSTNIPAVIGAVLGLILLLALIILLLLWRRKKRVQRQLASLGAETSSRELSMARDINTDPRLRAAPTLGSENGADISETPMTEAVAGGSVWATSNKARMYAEEAMPGTSATDLSSIELSTYTASNTFTDSPPAPVYQIQSSSSQRERERGRRGHRIGGSSRDDHPHRQHQQTENALSRRGRDVYASDSYSTLTGSSNSMSTRAFAQAAAPNLSPSDIDRLAESIVRRMQGRDPALRERIVEEAGSSVVTEDEPPPPWSAPGVSVHEV